PPASSPSSVPRHPVPLQVRGLQHLPRQQRHPVLQVPPQHHPQRRNLLRVRRPQQHHRDHRVHIGQRGRPLQERLQEEQLLVRLVLLLRGAVLHHGGDGGRAGGAHVHRPAQAAAGGLPRPRLPAELGHHPDPQLPLPLPPALPLQLPLHGALALPRRLARGPEGLRRAAVHRDLHVHAHPGPAQVRRHAHRHLQLREGPQLPAGPQLHSEGPERLHQHSQPPHHPRM
ncbi:hypothetical protein COCON_G00024650, partial [Conger conger]